MSTSDLTSFVEAWRERFAHAEREREELASRARSLLPGLVDHLVRSFGVRRVWLFGSLVEGTFDESSDIDLAVEGLPNGSVLFRAAAELEDRARPFRIDLVPLEEARAAVRERILRTGEALYG